MITNTVIHSLNHMSGILFFVLSMTLIKSILLFAIVMLLIRVFKVQSLRTKYVLWAAYMFSIAPIALYTAASPRFNIVFIEISPHRFDGENVLSSLLFPKQETATLSKVSAIDHSLHLKKELPQSYRSLHWPFWILCGWITGIVLNLFYTLTGRIGATYLSRNTSKHKISYFKEEISRLARDIGIKRRIEVKVSYRCRLPFTYNIMKPENGLSRNSATSLSMSWSTFAETIFSFSLCHAPYVRCCGLFLCCGLLMRICSSNRKRYVMRSLLKKEPGPRHTPVTWSTLREPHIVFYSGPESS